jgi:Fe-S-cluster containining protein
MPGCSAESGTCDRCRSACDRKPGWFLPGEAEKTAEYLGLSLLELFREHLAVDWWDAVEPVFLLSPAVRGNKAGQEFPGDPTGSCVFFEEGRCRIHRAKPHECAVSWCGGCPPDTHYTTATAWEGHQDQIRGLLGREPQDEPFYGWLGL